RALQLHTGCGVKKDIERLAGEVKERRQPLTRTLPEPGGTMAATGFTLLTPSSTAHPFCY
ncbi:hypothetical protein ABXK91_20775, partial [Yersinia enterocolitica]